MVNPVTPAVNLWLGLLNALPSPIQLLIFVAAGFFVIGSIIDIVRK